VPPDNPLHHLGITPIGPSWVDAGQGARVAGSRVMGVRRASELGACESRQQTRLVGAGACVTPPESIRRVCYASRPRSSRRLSCARGGSARLRPIPRQALSGLLSAMRWGGIGPHRRLAAAAQAMRDVVIGPAARLCTLRSLHHDIEPIHSLAADRRRTLRIRSPTRAGQYGRPDSMYAYAL
jgi:hypothetical protein